MKDITLKFTDTKLRIKTNFLPYYDYLQSYFAKIVDENNAEPDVEVEFLWEGGNFNKYMANHPDAPKFQRIGSNTYLHEDAIVAKFKLERKWPVIFDYSKEDGRSKYRIVLRKKMPRDFFRFSRPQDQMFFTLSFYIIYYPLFWHSENTQQRHMLHASGISINQKGIILCGLDGIGKTSLSLMFLKEKGAKFIADNLLFYDTEKFYPCFELLRLFSGDDDSLWTEHFEKNTIFDETGKGYFAPKSAQDSTGEKPEIMIFPEFSPEFTVQELDAEQAAHRAITLSHFPKELNAYCEFRQLFNLVNMNTKPWPSQYDVLNHLLANCRCCRIGMPKEDGLAANYGKLLKAIQ